MSVTTNNTAASGVQLDENLFKKIQNEIEKRQIKNYKIETSIGSTKGDNFLGVLIKITISGINNKGDKVKLNWIGKQAPKVELLRKIINIDDVYDREIYFYEKLLPFFEKIQIEREVLSPFTSYAGYVLSNFEPYSESLVMEDMKSIGYTMQDKKKPLDLHHVKLVMEAYGKLHAFSFAMRDQYPEEFKKFAEETPEKFFINYYNKEKGNEVMKDKHREVAIGRILDSLNPVEDADAIEVYKMYAKKDFDIILDAVQTQNQYSVIGHGDSWVNNMLFKYENENNPSRPTKICLLDWQLAKYGSPSFDLSYFIFTCTDKKLRDKYYDQMIKFYYHSLCKFLIDLGSDPEKLFPYNALLSELKRGSVYGFTLTTMVLHIMLCETDEIPDWDNSIDENKVMEGFNSKSINEKVYQERIRSVVLDFVKFGYFDMAKC